MQGFWWIGAAVAPSRLQGKSPQTARPLCYPPLAQRAALDEWTWSAVFVNLLNCTAIRGGEEGRIWRYGPSAGVSQKGRSGLNEKQRTGRWRPQENYSSYCTLLLNMDNCNQFNPSTSTSGQVMRTKRCSKLGPSRLQGQRAPFGPEHVNPQSCSRPLQAKTALSL